MLQDVDDSQSALHTLTKLAFAEKWSLVCAWSRQEVARYIETFKLYEHKPADLIQGRTDDDYTSKLIGCLTAVRLVNKTDVSTLASTFGTLKDVMTAPPHEIKLCPGIGELKATRLADTFQAPFLIKKKQPGTSTSATSSQRQLQPIALQPVAPTPASEDAIVSGAAPAAVSSPIAGRRQLVQDLLGQYAQHGLAAEPVNIHHSENYSSNAGGNFRIDLQMRRGSDCDAVVLQTGARSNLACVMVSGEAGLKEWEALQQSLPPPAPVYVQPSGTIVMVSYQLFLHRGMKRLCLAPSAGICAELLALALASI